ncbi:MAG: 3-dehydroquinate synthase [Xanthomonadaceae bacterium]|nr:3-dehydroquinate synthase [Xanthomonadaceae bacterium]
MLRLTIELGARSYPVLIGEHALAEPDLAAALGPRSIVVTSESVAPLHLAALQARLAEHPHTVVTVADGDAAKTLQTVERIVDAAVVAGVGRDGTVVALGGGAVGDVAGLAAALFHRGIGFIQVPTTLLAQVDAAVGGKTAVNHRAGKNLVGAFHQPRLVICDIALLRTLPPRELRAGLAEVIKYALLEPGDLWDWLEANIDALLATEPKVVAEAVDRCLRVKARIVAADETERGQRALLNLGHTFGHAIETLYAGKLLHGEAVALGCVMAARMSQSLGWLPADAVARITSIFTTAGLPVALPAPVPTAEAVLEAMGRDKKVAGGRIRLVLLRDIGDAVVTADYPHAALLLTLRDFTSNSA